MAAMGNKSGASGEGATGIKIALIVFVVLTVASLAGTIILYTYQSDLQAQAASANTQSQDAQQRATDAENRLQNAAKSIAGDGDPAKMAQALKTAQQNLINSIERPEARAAATEPATDGDTAKPRPPLLTLVNTLNTRYAESLGALDTAKKDIQNLQDQIKKATDDLKATQDQYAEKTKKLEDDYQALEQQAAKNREDWQKQVQDLTAQLETRSEAAGQQLTGERQQRRAVEQQLADAQKRSKELVDTLSQFRPKGDTMSALQIADGYVVRAVAGDKIAYISLGAKDGIKRGMSFSVYSRTKGIPDEGKGKGAVEVTQVFDDTAECRVSQATNGEPLVEGDLIANPFFDRSRKLNFVVAGDFDLNFDGEAEDPGGEQVSKMIVQSGGNVVKQLDTRTDFVVLGGPPPQPSAAANGESPEAQQRSAQRLAARKAFDEVANEAKALSIPVLTRTRLLHYLGMGVPKNTPNDRLPW
ncbi:MAG: hypothetical protein KA354_10245 [Phycisphaerae bacterium]|nr:hypothetical protein [Phycisphaerae bacterium]